VEDGYARLTPPALHSRAVLFLKGDYWVIRDRILTDGDHHVELHLHFAPGIGLEILSPSRDVGTWGTDSQPARLEIGIFGHQGVMCGGEDWVSSSYGALSPARTCAFTAHAQGPRDLVSFFVPRSAGEDAIEIQERPASRGRAFTIVGRGVQDVLLVSGGAGAASGDLSSDAAWAWVRKPPGDELPSEFVLVQGRYLGCRGRTLVQADGLVRCVAARRKGSALHIEVEADRRCEVDSLGANCVVVNGVSTPAASVRTAAAGSGATSPVAVS